MPYVKDGCEWNPLRNSAAFSWDEHTRTTQAEWLVGANGQWRLCDRCSKLWAFRRFRVRKRIGPEPEKDSG